MKSCLATLMFSLLVYQACSRGSHPLAETLYRPMTCQRLQLPAQYTAGERGLFNPAAVRHPQHGWVVMYRYDPCHTGMSKGCKHTFTWPFMSSLGNDSLPDPGLAGVTLAAMKYTEQTVRAVRAQLHTNDTLLGDMRPFMWGGDLFISHWVYSEDTKPVTVVQAISRVDVEKKEIDLQQVFRVIGRRRVEHKVEKNWGFVDAGSDLLIFYQALPHTLIARKRRGPGPVLVDTAWQLRPMYHRWVHAQTGLDVTSHVHNSGHPQRWNNSRGEEEYVMMVHQRKQGKGYAHWVLRMTAGSMQVTHVSAGPVLKWADYRLRGFKNYALIMGSYHLFSAVEAGGSHAVLRVLFGEGDKYSCWEEFDYDGIQWLQLDGTHFSELHNHVLDGGSPGV